MKSPTATVATVADPRKAARAKDWKKNRTVYFLFIPIALYFFVFHYLPMFGIVMAFQDFSVVKGFFGSKFVGLENFIELFSGEAFGNAFKNTVIIILFNLSFGFLAPLVFAFLITSVENKKIRRVCQTISYLPNFVATVVVVNLVQIFVGYDGPLTMLLTKLGFENQNWLANANPPVFWVINCLMGIWQGFGFGSIMFVAAITNVNGDLHEAAALDGATKFQRMMKVTLPCIAPLVLMLFTLQVGMCFKVGFDKILLMYMPQTYSVADTIYTYTYRLAFGTAPDFGLSAASSLFQSVLGTILLVVSNKLNKKVGGAQLY